MAAFNITKLSLNRPVLLGVFFGIVLLAGIYSLFRLNIELVPKFNPPVLTIVTIYPGATAQEVETEVSIPIENALSGLEGLETMTSTSQNNFSLVRLEIESGTDVIHVLNEANRKLISAKSELPAATNQPVLSRFDFDDLPMMRLSINAVLTDLDLSRLVEEQIIPKLSQLEGVAQIDSYGATNELVSIEVLPERLSLTNTSILQVVQALGKNNIQVPTGALQLMGRQQQTLFSAHVKSIDELKNIIIFENEQYGIKIRIKDVAKVSMDERTPEVISRFNGEAAVCLEVKKQADANAVNVSNNILQEITLIQEEFRNIDLKIQIAQDISIFTRKAVDSVADDLMLAIVLVSLVMLVFLHSFRNAVIVFFSIPICIFSTFVAMYFLGYTLNLLSLLGLSLAIGILVDDSIVVIENIYRHLQMGKPSKEAAYIGRMEIGKAAVSITLIDVVVFLPLVFSSGMVSDLLRQFAVVIVVSTLMSLLVSLSLIPWLASRFHSRFQRPKSYLLFVWIDRLLDQLASKLLNVLRWSLAHKGFILTLILSLILSTSTLFIYRLIGIEFTKAGDRSEFIVELSYEKGADLQATSEVAKKAELVLLGYPDVEAVLTKVGVGSRGRITINDPSLAEMYVKLVDKSSRNYSSAQFARHVKYHLMQDIPGLEVRPIDINIIGLRNDDAVQVTLLDDDEERLDETVRKLSALLETTPGAVEVQNTLESGTTTLTMHPDRARMATLKIDPARVGIALRTALNGHDAFKYYFDDRVLPIRIKMKQEHFGSIMAMKKMTVINNEGKLINMSEILDFQEEEVFGRLERTNRIRSATIQSQVYGRPAGSVSRAFQASISSEKMDDYASLAFGGATKRTIEGILSMIVALVVSVVLVYAVLVILYNSYGVPLVVLVSLPLATVGAFLLLALAGEALSIFSIMGLIILAGLVGKNAILVVDVARKRINEGLSVKEALLEATHLRLRPILMTNLTMIVGLLPIALSSSAGSEWKNGLAWALIGGLSSSMLLSLIVVPVIYDLTTHIKSRLLPNHRKN